MKQLTIAATILGLFVSVGVGAEVEKKSFISRLSYDLDTYGSVTSQNMERGRGAIGERLSIWYNNIGVSATAEADNIDRGNFVDRSTFSVGFRVPDFTKSGNFIPELRAGYGFEWQLGDDGDFLEATLGARHKITKHISLGYAAGARKYLGAEGSWHGLGQVFAGLTW